MTISAVSNTGADHYVGDGSNTTFTGRFQIALPSEATVMIGDVIKAYGTQYTITGFNQPSFTVTFFTAPLSGEKITILRNQPIQQTSTYLLNETYAPLKILGDLDKGTKVDQMLAERIYRALKFDPTSALSDVPVTAPQGNKFLGWNNSAPWMVENKDFLPADSVIPSNNIPSRVYSTSGAGVSTEFSRSDHRHQSQRGWFNVLDYGADRTAGADSWAAFIAAHAAAMSTGGIMPVIYIPDGAYLISGQLPCGFCRWIGESVFGVLIYQTTSATAINGVFRADGTATESTAPAVAFAKGDRTIQLLDASGYAIGDLIEIRLTENATQVADGTHNAHTLITRIMNKSGDVLTLLHAIPFPYASLDTCPISKITPTQTEICNLTIDGINNTGHDPFGNNGIVIFYSQHIRLENIYTRNMQKGNGIFLWSCFAGLVKNHFSENVGDIIGFGSALAPNDCTATRFENIMSLWSSRDGMTFNRGAYCQYVNLYSQYCQVRNVKFHGCRQDVAVNITGNNSQGGTGLTISGGTSDCAFSNITTTGNKGPNASGNQNGVWFADLASCNNVLSNINSWDNGDWDITIFTTDTGNVVYGGRFSSATKILNQNSTAMFNVTLDDVLSGGLTSLAMVDTRSAGAAGPSHRLYRHFPNNPGTAIMGEYVFTGSNSIAALVEYAKMFSYVLNYASTAETARIAISVFSAGVNNLEMQIGDGVSLAGLAPQGVGTLNAEAVYDNGVLLTDYVFEGKQTERFNPEFLDLEKYIEFWKTKGHLPSMPSRDEWGKGKKSLGDLVQRLWETVELQAVHIAKLLEPGKKKVTKNKGKKRK